MNFANRFSSNFVFLSLFILYMLVSINICNAAENNKNTDGKLDQEQCNSTNCRLPLCKCSNVDRPGKVNLDDTPMMIGITFNGILSAFHSDYIKRILNPIYKNPNGCSVQGTFFVSDIGNRSTDYCFVQSLFNNNNEIGVGSVKYNCPYTDCESLGRYFRKWKTESSETEIFQQKKNIAAKARINRSFLKGFRLPHLDQAGNSHFSALKKYAFSYDSSVIIKPEDIKKQNGFRFWPHTLDFPVNYSCSACPTKKSLCRENFLNCTIDSMWIVPMHYFNADGKHPCPTLIKDEIPDNRLETKECIPRSKITQKILEEQLFDNFKRHYETNKAPFIINIETVWFEKYAEILTNALVKFVHDLTSIKSIYAVKKDIYFVSISKIVDWMEYPTPLNVIASRWLWDCDGINYDYDEECDIIKKILENSEEMEEIKKKNRTVKFDLQTEELYRNGVLTAVIVIFTISILFTIFYDKYY